MAVMTCASSTAGSSNSERAAVDEDDSEQVDGVGQHGYSRDEIKVEEKRIEVSWLSCTVIIYEYPRVSVNTYTVDQTSTNYL